MRVPPSYHLLNRLLARHMPYLRPAQRQGLAWWVCGTILAGSACQSAVVTALAGTESTERWRQYLREWLYDGADRASPCQTCLEVSTCFAPLLGWVLSWWHATQLALAIDATYQRDRWVVLSVSVLYRGSAIPVAWQVLPGNTPVSWGPALTKLLSQLAPCIPPTMTVLVLTDRGLWSPRLWEQLRRLGWHPLMRLRPEATFAPTGATRQPAAGLLAGPGTAWVGRGTAFKEPRRQQVGTLLAVQTVEAAEPWLLLTDLPPAKTGLSWYSLRAWIEVSFRNVKRFGWQWQRTRRQNPDRIARHWLVLSVATLWVLACGTRIEDAEQSRVDPSRLRYPPPRPTPVPRRRSLFQRGLTLLRRHLLTNGLWQRLWLVPEPWPDTPPDLIVTYHDSS